MNPAQLERLAEHLQKLRLFKSRERLEALLQEAAGKEMAYSDFLEQVLSEMPDIEAAPPLMTRLGSRRSSVRELART